MKSELTEGVKKNIMAIIVVAGVGLSGLILSGNALYGTAEFGGNSGNGTVFSLSFAPQLTIVPSAVNVILKWPTNYAAFDFSGFTL